jgi:23S rRNA (cytidine1920-2'-O)/16S rRNA (cytidine1409-2'-O)-methyltransferase
MKHRLDHLMLQQKLVPTRSQAESYIRMGHVKVDGKAVTKPGYFVSEHARIEFGAKEQYVSRAALKLASVTDVLGIDFKGKVVLDVGSSTGGFTDFALQHRAKKSIAVDVGTDQLHSRLRVDERVELHEKTDIRNVQVKGDVSVRHSEPTEGSSIGKERSFDVPQDSKNITFISEKADIAVIDVSFISITMVLPNAAKLVKKNGAIIAMVKPQFEAGKNQLNKGVVKNSAQRREILRNFETWCRQNKFAVLKKSDSAISGKTGNIERFYLLKVV